jgi:curved DNA-binding protein CbpA
MRRVSVVSRPGVFWSTVKKEHPFGVGARLATDHGRLEASGPRIRTGQQYARSQSSPVDVDQRRNSDGCHILASIDVACALPIAMHTGHNEGASMPDDPYETLGLERTATADDIKKAYRKLVRTSHPDLHPDDKGAEARFKAISAAYDILKDPETRARFDAGEIDGLGQERPQRRYYRDFADAADNTYRQGRGFGPDADPTDIFAEILRNRARTSANRFRRRRVFGRRSRCALHAGGAVSGCGPRGRDPDHAARGPGPRGQDPARHRGRADPAVARQWRARPSAAGLPGTR